MAAAIGAKPVIILVRPQLGENIGLVARAMGNFAVDELRLVAPRDGWPNPAARAPASGADWILDNAKVYATVNDAVADLHHVYATTARNRGMIQAIATPHHAAEMMQGQIAEGKRIGILFGAEATGLHNDELVRANTMITIPCNPEFSSFNLSQAVLLLCYEWFRSASDVPAMTIAAGEAVPATQDEIEGMLAHLEQELTLSGFLRPPEKAGNMMNNIRSLFLRMPLLDQDVRTLRGIFKSLALYGRSAGKPRA